jgi:hypothetical protein
VVKKYVVRFHVNNSYCQYWETTNDTRGNMYTYDTALKYALELRNNLYNSNVRIVAIVG